MGLAYRAIHRHKNAIKCYEKALEINPKLLFVKRNLEDLKKFIQ